jgi:DNA polymerase-3 subunit delta'
LGLATHGIASARLLSRQLRLTPAMARHKVFVVGDAERLVAQRANPEAANALLKALEEPPADTVLVLTSSEPEALLPTILSRVVRARVARLPDTVVTQFAQRELGMTAQRALEQRVTSAEGSIGRLLAEDTGRGAGAAVEAVLAAARGTPAGRYALALGQPPFQARGAFTALLDDLLERLRGEARAGRETRAVVAAMARVLDAREQAQGNVNPQLLAAVLVEDLWSVA